MSHTAELANHQLPSRSRLYAYFREHCPDCLNLWTKHKEVPQPPHATAVHEVWQVDHQEGHRLGDGQIATVCNIRDPYGAAMIASQAFAVKTEKRWRKLTWEEVRQALRIGFCEWHTLPDSIQTDNEMGLGGNPHDPFPSWLSLYLAGLGIKHIFIRSHRPTDQPHIERNHRTLDGLTDDEESRQSITSFQQALDRERCVYNQQFPTRASDCQQEPPLIAHPALLTPRRLYRPEWEPVLFDIQLSARSTAMGKSHSRACITPSASATLVKIFRFVWIPAHKSGFSWKWMLRAHPKNFADSH